ncbi:cytochrome b/b6 domain-containing protein [Homoserinibacter sp. GY 40078]|uniref:cytochrome b/b6 domain-containing protein n=1 Tax=Homoserinibacter sp. GY 40078 TaxID=2603275 RepID=UPI002103246D|nr:cytochrome b/b6 domain-containing protein [Homoserinibacter sp. GY 40078]
MTPPPETPTAGRRIRLWIAVGIGIVVLAVVAVAVARGLRTLEPVQEFLQRYPGEYPLPKGAPVGLPAWLGWQHFFNAFLLVLVVRTGWQSRRERNPRALWTSRRNRRRRMSLTVWTHLALDLLWIVNGVVYVVLLFATGQWMRIVPTSWDVIPNAISALLQYVSFDWPTTDGWVNYNSLQQLSYFAIVFIASPLAIATGYRMSALWPRDAQRLSRIVPFDLARAIHFPVMLVFVLFVIVHVGLVLTTGALRNLNHIYTASDEVNPVGFAIFVVSLLVIAAGWALVRPTLAAVVARRFGEVRER